jgi:hypothetical protein
MAGRSYKNVAQFRYLGTAVTNENLIQEEIKRRLRILVMLATIQCRTLACYQLYDSFVVGLFFSLEVGDMFL